MFSNFLLKSKTANQKSTAKTAKSLPTVTSNSAVLGYAIRNRMEQISPLCFPIEKLRQTDARAGLRRPDQPGSHLQSPRGKDSFPISSEGVRKMFPSSWDRASKAITQSLISAAKMIFHLVLSEKQIFYFLSPSEKVIKETRILVWQW